MSTRVSQYVVAAVPREQVANMFPELQRPSASLARLHPTSVVAVDERVPVVLQHPRCSGRRARRARGAQQP
eukprot:7285105-Alexandrium_andersonii.AAC.1